MDEQQKRQRFDGMIMPHLDAAYNLARWLTHNDHDAQDVVQEAFLRAFKFFDGFNGTNSRSWLLSIVRNASYSWLHKNRRKEITTEFDEESHGIPEKEADLHTPAFNKADYGLVRQAVEALPAEYREVTILRELEGMSYKEIAEIINAPIGTVMSRLARARKQLHRGLSVLIKESERQ